MKLLRSEWLAVRVQIGLGIVFLLAAWPKLGDPPSFAHMVWNYQLLPDALVNLQSILLPGIELTVGLALVLGVWPRAAAWLCLAMLAMFMVALAVALAMDNPVICGCFDVTAATKTDAEKFHLMKMDLLRDVVFVLMAVHVLWARPRPEGSATDLSRAAHEPEAAGA